MPHTLHLNIGDIMETRTCSNCGTTQLWDELFGFANRFCPAFCNRLIPFPEDMGEKTEEDVE
jgi:hypothetical protein